MKIALIRYKKPDGGLNRMGAYWFRTNMEGVEKTALHELTVTQNHFTQNRTGAIPYLQMNTEGFVVTPGQVMMDVVEPLENAPSLKTTAETYIKRGCTLLIIQHLVNSLCHFRKHYDTFLTELCGLPVDYMIAPIIPAPIVRPEMIRFFSRRGCPFLCIQVEKKEELSSIKWEWIVQAQSYKRMPVTLIVKDSENTYDNYSELWSSICEQYGIIKLSDLQDDNILSLQNIKDSGIFPQRGAFQTGGFADYNLYLRCEGAIFDEQQNIRYHDSVPNVTVSRGLVKQVNQTIIDESAGSHVKVGIHKHFV